MPALRGLLSRAASFGKLSQRRLAVHDEEEEGEYSIDVASSPKRDLTKTLSGETSSTEVSSSSLADGTAVECRKLSSNDMRRQRRKARVSTSQIASKETMAALLKSKDGVNPSGSSRRIIVRRKKKSSRPTDCEGRTVATSVASTSLSSSSSQPPSSSPRTPKPRRIRVKANDLGTQSFHESFQIRDSPSSPLKSPTSAPSTRKQKIVTRSLPRAPLGTDGLYRKAKSTRDLIKEYETILEDFNDSTRGPRSNNDLLEEYCDILTEHDDSTRPNNRTAFSTGW